jgi:hypothetical protein
MLEMQGGKQISNDVIMDDKIFIISNDRQGLSRIVSS